MLSGQTVAKRTGAFLGFWASGQGVEGGEGVIFVKKRLRVYGHPVCFGSRFLHVKGHVKWILQLRGIRTLKRRRKMVH